QPAQPGRRRPVNTLHAVGRHVLTDRGRVRWDIEHPPAELFIASGARGQRIERSDRPDHRVDDDRPAAGNAERPGKKAKGIPVAQLDRAKGEEAPLLEPPARRPASRPPTLEAEDSTRVVARQVGEVRQFDQWDWNPGPILDRELLFEVIAYLVLPLRAGASDREVIGGQPAPEIAHDEDQDQGIEQAVRQPDPRDVGKEKEKRERRDQGEPREPHGRAKSRLAARSETPRSAAAPVRSRVSGSTLSPA